MTHQVLMAAQFAARVHHGQLRKYMDVPYIVHPLSVATQAAIWNLPEHVVIAALLHDVIEDCPHPTENALFIQKQYPDSWPLVHAMTKLWVDHYKGEDLPALKQQYFAGLCAVEYGPELKLLDMTDNLNTMRTLVSSQYRWAKNYLAKVTTDARPLLLAAKHGGILEAFVITYTRLSTQLEQDGVMLGEQ